MKFYISDLHIGHENILQYDNRPFKNTVDMHKQIIIRWNRVVKPTDEVYILGDFAWKNAIGDEVLSQLCGRKFLILGNHDRPTTLMQNCFEWIKEYAFIQDEQTQVILCHYPIANWYNQYRFAVHLYGHVHNNKDAILFREYLNLLRANNVPAAAYNVGCMMPYMDYTPRTILEIMKSNLIEWE